MRFPVPTDIHPKCRGRLERSAQHLATLTPKQRARWLQDQIETVRDMPRDGGITAVDITAVITTLHSWQEQSALEAA